MRGNEKNIAFALVAISVVVFLAVFILRAQSVLAISEEERERLESHGLIILPAAKSPESGSGAFGSEWTAYLCRSPCSPQQAVADLSSALADLGWEPLKEAWMNPGVPSSHVKGWGSYTNDATNLRMRTYQWIGAWMNGQGEVVTYRIAFSKHQDRKSIEDLRLNGTWYPADGVEIMEAAARGPAEDSPLQD